MDVHQLAGLGPYVRGWSQAYRDDGLVGGGVHTPELSFEYDIEGVRAFYIVAYAALSLPAIAGGIVVGSLRVSPTFEVFGSAAAALGLVWRGAHARSRAGHITRRLTEGTCCRRTPSPRWRREG